MYNPTRWERIKNILRYIKCRHKHTETRTIIGEDGEVLASLEYCFDCERSKRHL